MSLFKSVNRLASTILIVAVSAPLVSAEKYLSWFYWYNRPDEPTLSNLQHGVCSGVFANYSLSVTNGTVDGLGSQGYCYQVEDCMLDNLRPSFIANYQAAAVILGIMPTLLATLGPRIGEISLLSTTRPLLSFLISIGAPAVWPTRVFEYDDPSSALGKGVNRRVIRPQDSTKARIYSCLQYAMVCGAIVNIMQVAIILGRQTVLSWSCEFDYGPLAWGLIPAFIHSLAALSYRFEVRVAEKKALIEQARSNSDYAEPDSQKSYGENATENPLRRRMTFLAARNKLSWWQKEFTICANQPRGLASLLQGRQLPYFAVFFNCIASLCAFFHLFFGTIIFSSLTFIAVYDILNFIFWRYILSTVLCRLVLLIELMGMREDLGKDVDKVADEMVRVKRRLSRVESDVVTLRSPPVSPRPEVTKTGIVETFEMDEGTTGSAQRR